MSRRRLSGRAAAVLSRHGLSHRSHRYSGERESSRFSTGAAAHQELEAADVEERRSGREEIQLDLAVPDPVIVEHACGSHLAYCLPSARHGKDPARFGLEAVLLAPQI